jgi:hypothetical protein
MVAASAQMPPHLEPLLQPTPSGVAKLLAAWDGLQVETQIDLLSRLPQIKYPAYLAAKIRETALRSETPYVRYMAYRGAYLNSDNAVEMAAKRRIEADPEPLVQYSTKEIEWAIGDKEISDAATFLALPHEARLAKVRLLKANGDDIAKIISFAVENHLKDSRISETEIYEILADYLLKPSFRQHYEGDKWRRSYDGYGEFTAGRDIEALWRLIPEIPANLAHLLIETLPPEAGLSIGIPAEVIRALTDQQLQTLLYRRDIALLDIRREIFKTASKDREGILAAAISSHFSIENAEFSELLRLPERERQAALRNLAIYAGDLRLCVYEALNDYLSITDKWEDAAYAEIAKERKLSDMQPGWRRDDEVRQLRLYLLARQTAPLAKNSIGGTIHPPHGDLEFLARHAKRGDPWQTFIAFETQWQSSSTAKSLESSLPRIGGVDPEDEFSGIHSSVEASDPIAEMKPKLDQVLATLRMKLGESETKSPTGDALTQVVSEVATLHEVVSDDLKRIGARLTDLEEQIASREPNPDKEWAKKFEKSQATTRRILYVIVTALALILLRTLL